MFACNRTSLTRDACVSCSRDAPKMRALYQQAHVPLYVEWSVSEVHRVERTVK